MNPAVKSWRSAKINTCKQGPTVLEIAVFISILSLSFPDNIFRSSPIRHRAPFFFAFSFSLASACRAFPSLGFSSLSAGHRVRVLAAARIASTGDLATCPSTWLVIYDTSGAHMEIDAVAVSAPDTDL
jgi:hypothetical protein